MGPAGAVHGLEDTVGVTIGGHVNVLSDYKETISEKRFKFLHSHCNNVTDMLIKSRQNHIPLLKCKHVYKIQHVFLHLHGYVKMAKLTTVTKLCPKCVITLQIHQSTESTGVWLLQYTYFT